MDDETTDPASPAPLSYAPPAAASEIGSILTSALFVVLAIALVYCGRWLLEGFGQLVAADQNPFVSASQRARPWSDPQLAYAGMLIGFAIISFLAGLVVTAFAVRRMMRS